MRYIKQKKSTTPEVNLTPLIDVVFVILISFMVVAPLLDLDSIELASGSSSESKNADSSPIRIHVFQDNSLRLNDQKMLLPQLKKTLVQMHEAMPGAKPLVFHDRRAQFGTYQEVKNALEIAGFENMDIVLSPR